MYPTPMPSAPVRAYKPYTPGMGARFDRNFSSGMELVVPYVLLFTSPAGAALSLPFTAGPANCSPLALVSRGAYV